MSRSGALYAAPGSLLSSSSFGAGYYASQAASAFATAANPADQAGQFTPFWVPAIGGFTFTKIAVRTTLAATSGGLCRLGIYRDTGGGIPGALVLDAGTVDATATAGHQEKAINQALSPGMYWLVAVPQGAAATQATYERVNASLAARPQSSSQTALTPFYTQTGISAGLPSPAVPTGDAGNAIAVWLGS